MQQKSNPNTSPAQAPTGLLCELLSHPEATLITTFRPSFGWIVSDTRRGAVQTAYQILVSSSDDVDERSADLWNSGKIASAESVNVRYSGDPLPADSTCWWAVRTWDRHDKPSPWSKPQRINIGPLDSAQPFYSDQWLDTRIDGKPTGVRPNRHPLEVHRISPKSVVRTAPGRYFIDFGRAAFGTLEMTLDSDSDGREIEIRLGEKRSGDAVDTNPGGSVVYQKHTLSLMKGKHTYKLELPPYERGIRMPKHIGEVAPFRYCEIVDSPSDSTASDLAQLAVHYRFDDAASAFDCSDHTLNDVWDLCKYSIKATSFLGVYVDGQRERLPYEADAYINQLGHYSVDREFAMARYSHEHLITHPTWPTEWILFSVLIAWEDYMYTGNLDSIRRTYCDLMAKALLPLAREDGLISTRTGLMTPEVMQSVHYHGKKLRDIVDWPQPAESDGYVFTSINTVVNAFHYRALVLLARMAQALGKTDDAARFRSRASLVRASFNDKLFDRKKGIYRDGEGAGHSSLHANMFALAFGLVDDEHKPPVVEFIKSRGMACSVYGAQFLLEALYESGENEAALRLMAGEGDRSWPHMIYDIGSTITLEAWDPKYKPNLDWNHAWGAAPANIIPRMLVGVRPIEPGFAKVRIRPRIGSLTNVSAKIPSIRGPIEVRIKRDESEYRLHCTIPANMTAELHLPAQDPSHVLEGTRPTSDAQGVTYLGKSNCRLVYAVGSGDYEFSVRQPSGLQGA